MSSSAIGPQGMATWVPAGEDPRCIVYVTARSSAVAAFAIAYVGRHHGVEAAILNVILSTPVVVSNPIPTYLPTYTTGPRHARIAQEPLDLGFGPLRPQWTACPTLSLHFSLALAA